VGDIVIYGEPFALHERTPIVNHALTALLQCHMFYVDDRMWSVVTVYDNQTVLMRRESDAPYYDRPGVALHRVFSAKVISDATYRKWDEMDGWDA
jgi:uncharacterized membrane protein